MNLERLMAAVCVSSLTGVACAQLINDADMDDLTPGTPPDNDVAAGAWAFPDNYIAAGVAEALPENFTIVATSDFDEAAEGNSLALNIQEAVLNYHLPNPLTSVINEGDGLVFVSFEIWVAEGAGGGSVYVGGDHGGGGFGNTTDRGPQVSWFPDGTLHVWDNLGASVVVANFSPNVWQSVQLDIDLVSDTYDMFWASGDDDLAQVADDQPFRSTTQDFLDRFSYVRFAGEGGVAVSYIDEIEITVTPTKCTADCNADGVLNILDFVCFQGEWQNQTDAGDCDGNGQYNILDFVCYQGEFQAGCP
jgi:hypothetical protein